MRSQGTAHSAKSHAWDMESPTADTTRLRKMVRAMWPTNARQSRSAGNYRESTIPISESSSSFVLQEKAGERVPSHRLESNYGTSAIALGAPCLLYTSPSPRD